MPRLTQSAAKQRIRDAGLRATAPRIAVLRALSASARPLSHGEMVDLMDSEDLDQATIYRNLRKLVEVELARSVETSRGVTRYQLQDSHAGPHLQPRFSCRTCGTVEPLPDAKLTGAIARRWIKSLEASQLQVIGDCPECLEAN